jgi:hypothetical protein
MKNRMSLHDCDDGLLMLIARNVTYEDKGNLIITDRRFRDSTREDMLMHCTWIIPARQLVRPIVSPDARWIVPRARHADVEFPENGVGLNLALFEELLTLRLNFMGISMHDIISHLPIGLDPCGTDAR